MWWWAEVSAVDQRHQLWPWPGHHPHHPGPRRVAEPAVPARQPGLIERHVTALDGSPLSKVAALDGWPERSRAGHGRWRLPADAGQPCRKACWGNPQEFESPILRHADLQKYCSSPLTARRSEFPPVSFAVSVLSVGRRLRRLNAALFCQVTSLPDGQERRGARRRSVRPAVQGWPGPSATWVQVAVARPDTRQLTDRITLSARGSSRRTRADRRYGSFGVRLTCLLLIRRAVPTDYSARRAVVVREAAAQEAGPRAPAMAMASPASASRMSPPGV